MCIDWIDLFIGVGIAAGIGFFIGDLTGFRRGYQQERYRSQLDRDHQEWLRKQQHSKAQQPRSSSDDY